MFKSARVGNIASRYVLATDAHWLTYLPLGVSVSVWVLDRLIEELGAFGSILEL